MPLLDYVCPACGERVQKIVKGDSEKPVCKKCGSALKRDYSGKMYGATGQRSGGCSGDCKNCSGCK